MKLKGYIFTMLYVFGILLGVFSKGTWFIIGFAMILVASICIFIDNNLRWNKNRKKITSEYVRAKRENIIAELAILFSMHLEFKDIYMYRELHFEISYNEMIEINNFKDFLNTYDYIERLGIYMIIIFSIGLIISIIKKTICRDIITSKEILFSNGEIIELKDVKDIKVEDSFFGFSKKITLTLENKERIIHINNKSFPKVKNNFS
mgnify:CR=1 FL=1